MEIKGIKRDCLDFESGEIIVRRNWCTKTNRLNEYTKTKRDRKVPMSPALFQILADKRFLAADAFIFEWVTNAFGALKLQPMAVDARVTPIRFHDLRHTFASHLAMRGIPMIKIMELLGHKSLAMTWHYLQGLLALDEAVDAASTLSWGDGDEEFIGAAAGRHVRRDQVGGLGVMAGEAAPLGAARIPSPIPIGRPRREPQNVDHPRTVPEHGSSSS